MSVIYYFYFKKKTYIPIEDYASCGDLSGRYGERVLMRNMS